MVSLYVLAAGVNAAGKLNVAMVDSNGNTSALSLLLGQFDVSRAMTFDQSQLVVGKQATSFSELPIGSITGFVDDSLLFAGPTGTGKELSVLSLDAFGRKRIEQMLEATANKVTTGR